MTDATLYGQGLLPHGVRWQGSTYITQAYGAPLTFTQDFSFPSGWWEKAIEGSTMPAAEYNQTLFIGDVQGFWIFRLYLDGNLVGTYTFSDQQFVVPVTFDRVEAVAMGGMPFGNSSATVTATGSVPNTDPSTPVTDPAVPAPGVALTCAIAATLALWGQGRNRHG